MATDSSKMKILYLYGGTARKELFKKYQQHLIPDTPFFGLFALKKLPNVQTEFLETGRRVSLPLLFRIRHYDFVISPVALPLLLIKSILGFKKPKWIVFNINLINLLSKNRNKKWKYYFLLLALKKADQIICLCRKQKEFLQKAGIPKRQLTVIFLGIDKNFYWPSYNNKGYILSVGRDAGRDYKTLIKAVEDLNKKVIIVCSPKNLKDIRIIPPHIEVLYDLDYSQLKTLYENAEIVVVPSRKDAFLDGSDCSGQTVALDAMACAKPVILSQREWTQDYVEDKRNGLIVESENTEELRKVIDYLLTTPDLAKQIGFEARKRVEEEFNSGEMARQIFSLCQELKDKKTCPLCFSAKIKVKYTINKFRYLQCRKCHLVFLEQKLNDDELNALYTRQYFISDYKYQIDSFNYFSNLKQKIDGTRYRLSLMNNFISKNQRNLLDVGCATGYFLEAAKQAGFSVAGVELSPEAAKFAQREFKINIIGNDILFLPQKYNQTFDVLTMFHVLEHLTDPLRYLRRSYELLKPGGILVIGVPNIKSIDAYSRKNLGRILSPPRHLFVFSPENLKYAFQNIGFRVVKQKIFFSNVLADLFFKFCPSQKNKISTLHQVSSKTANKQKVTSRRRLKDILKRILEIIFPGSNMIFIAKKP